MSDSNGTDTSGHIYQTNLIANQAVIGSTGGVLTTLATANNAVFATNGSGVPSITATPTLTSITFPSAGGSGTPSSDTIGSYEEGTWTPAIQGVTSGGTTTYTDQHGYYIKVGRLVFLQFNVAYSAATGTGNVRLDGFPFTAQNVAAGFAQGPVQTSGVTYPAGTTSITLEVNVNNKNGFFIGSGSAVAAASVQMENAARTWTGCLTYIAST